jgi:hypothetical protein
LRLASLPPAHALACLRARASVPCWCLSYARCASVLYSTAGCSIVFGFPTGRAEHHAPTLRLQATPTVTDVARGTGQRGHQLRVTTRDQAPGPRLIGCAPPPHPRWESGEPHGRPSYAPDSRVRPGLSPGAATPCSAPAGRPAWPGHSGWYGRRPRWERPGRPPSTTAWTAGRAKAVRGRIHGAAGTPGRAGKVPWALHR